MSPHESESLPGERGRLKTTTRDLQDILKESESLRKMVTSLEFEADRLEEEVADLGRDLIRLRRSPKGME